MQPTGFRLSERQWSMSRLRAMRNSQVENFAATVYWRRALTTRNQTSWYNSSAVPAPSHWRTRKR